MTQQRAAGRSYAATIETLEDSGRKLVETASAHLGAPVPSCPGWEVAQLITHIGHIYDWAARNLTASPDERVRMGRPSDGGPERCAQALNALVRALRGLKPSTRCAGPLQPRTAAWWARRQLLETVIHRWDVENAVGTPAAIDAEVAAAGVAEFLEVFASGVRGQVVLRATDRSDDEWTVPGHSAATTSQGDSVVVTAPAAELLLLLWGRRELAGLAFEGSADTYASWRGSIAT